MAAIGTSGAAGGAGGSRVFRPSTQSKSAAVERVMSGAVGGGGGSVPPVTGMVVGNGSLAPLRYTLDLDGPRRPEPPPVGFALIKRNMGMFVALKTLGSFDSGAFSAVLGAEEGISERWCLSTSQQGMLTSSVFLGNTFGCLVAGHVLSRYTGKEILGASLLLHTGFTFIFASLPFYHLALLSRFLIGFTLAFIVVFTPIWVDEFAPKDRASVWQASHNAGVPLGIMLGYLIGAFIPTYTSANWEWAFYLKCIAMIPALVYVAKADRRSLNRRQKNEAALVAAASASLSGSAPPRQLAGGTTAITTATAGGTAGAAHAAPVAASASLHALSPAGGVGGSAAAGTGSYASFGAGTPAEQVLQAIRQSMSQQWRAWGQLVANGVYIMSVLAMCSLFFVVTGLQNFVTPYLRAAPFNASMKTIMAGFGCAVVTAPVLGVITGGILLDRIGGYHHNTWRCAWFALFWGVLAACFSVGCIFITTTASFLLVISMVLFCGGAIIPPGSGLILSSLPERMRPNGSAFSQMAFNLLGNFSGPMVCGWVAELTGDLRWGIYTVLLFSVVGLAPLIVLLVIASRMKETSTLLRGPHPRAGSRFAPHGVSSCQHAAAGGEDAGGKSLSIRSDHSGLVRGRAIVDQASPNGGGDRATASDAVVIGARGAGSGNGSPAQDSTAGEGSRLASFSATAVVLQGTAITGSPSLWVTQTGWQRPDAVPDVPFGARWKSPVAENEAVLNAEEESGRYESPFGEEDDEDLHRAMLELDSDAANMLSFPTQMTFGMDMVRSWLLLNTQRGGTRGHAGALESSTVLEGGENAPVAAGTYSSEAEMTTGILGGSDGAAPQLGVREGSLQVSDNPEPPASSPRSDVA